MVVSAQLLGIAGSILFLGLVLLVLAVQRERRLLAATTREAAEAVGRIEARTHSLQARLKELHRTDDVVALFAEAETEAPRRSRGRRRGRKRKRRPRS